MLQFGDQTAIEELSFTLYAEKPKKDDYNTVEKLVLSFSNESDFSAWFDAMKMKMNDILSFASLDYTPNTLFQILSILTINHGISSIEKHLQVFQPPVPPLPSDFNHVTNLSNENSNNNSFTPRRSRKNTTWIDDFNLDEDIDKMVDEKLSQLSNSSMFRSSTISCESPRAGISEDNNLKNRTSSIPVSPRDGTKRSSWITVRDTSTQRIRKPLLANPRTN